MNRTIAILAALAASLAAAGIVLAPGEAIDVEASYHDPDAGITQIVLRCSQTDAGLDCGDVEALPHLTIHGHDTVSARYSRTIGDSLGKVPARKSQCACGPRLRPNSCRVTVVGLDGKQTVRESVTGEYLPPGSWAGSCVPRPCWELSELVEAKGGPGYSLPEACR